MEHNNTISWIQPGNQWEEALPTGNGIIGACVYGQIREDCILINHERLYIPEPRPDLPNISKYVPELRKLLFTGAYEKAERFLENCLKEAGYLSFQPSPYQPAFEIRFTTETNGAFQNYRRRIDLCTGEVVVEWSEDSVQMRRGVFVSRPDNLIALRLQGERVLDCSISLMPYNLKWESESAEGIHVVSQDPPKAPFCPKNPPPVAFSMWTEDDLLFFLGRYNHGLAYGGVFRVRNDGGTIETGKTRVFVRNAKSVECIGKIFVFEDPDTAFDRLKEDVRSLKTGYKKLLRRHATIHSELYGRMSLSLDKSEIEKPVERLLLDAYDGEAPPALIETIFNFGRHLAICTNAPGSLPANLQGIWNGDYRPAFQCDFHHNINLQMCYWPLLPCGLHELMDPLVDYCCRWMDDWKENAEKIYGCRGILVANNQTTNGLVRLEPWINWVSGGAWLAQHLYDIYLYTLDEQFLRERVFPFMKEVALFYEDFLVEDESGQLAIIPSISPENCPGSIPRSRVTVNSTIDIACCRELLSHIIEACEVLNLDDPSLPTWHTMVQKLPAYRINEDGALSEWIDTRFPDNYKHRHISHLYPLFPGVEITPESPLFEAAGIAVNKRLLLGLTDQTAWSLMMLACLFSRLQQGSDAQRCLDLVTRSCVLPNLWMTGNDWRSMGITLRWWNWAPFQIDANFGLCAAVTEMMLFSRKAEIVLFPALPPRWQQGSVQGLRCRGGLVLETMDWSIPEKKIEFTIYNKSDKAITTTIRLGPIFEQSDNENRLNAITLTLNPGQRQSGKTRNGSIVF